MVNPGLQRVDKYVPALRSPANIVATREVDGAFMQGEKGANHKAVSRQHVHGPWNSFWTLMDWNSLYQGAQPGFGGAPGVTYTLVELRNLEGEWRAVDIVRILSLDSLRQQYQLQSINSRALSGHCPDNENQQKVASICVENSIAWNQLPQPKLIIESTR